LSPDPKLRKTSILSYRMGLNIGIPILLRPKDDSPAIHWINHTNQLLLRLVSHSPMDTTSSCSSSAISLRLPDRCVAFRVSPDLSSVGVFNCVLQQFYRERRPASLMARAAAAAGFTVKVFVEKHQITPMRIVRVFPNVSMTRAGAILVR